MDLDLSPAIKAFAAVHEAEIKAGVLKKMAEYFETTTSEHYHSKWDEGTKEHGALTEATLNAVNWTEEQTKEAKDAFWYEVLIRFRESRAESQE